MKIEIDVIRRTIRHIEKDNLMPEEDVKADLIIECRNRIMTLFDDETFIKRELSDLLRDINSLKQDEIARELSVINPESKKIVLEMDKTRIKEAMNSLRNDIGDVAEGKEDEYNSLKQQLIDIINQENSLEEKMPDDLKISKIFKFDYIVKNISSISSFVYALKDQISAIKFEFIEQCNNELSKLESEYEKNDIEISRRKRVIQEINEQIISIQERNDVKDVQENKYKLDSGLIQFFKDFEISEPYNNVDEALVIIKTKWNELENDFTSKEQENKEKIPMYEKISNYISSSEVIEADRKQYTRELFENANVFGITCTSSDRFNGRNLESLSEFNIDDFDIKSVGIDVVIIDEVSKSSFIDLLIPILYGKTVILVGDHRQLPPMYEFSKLRDDDFEGLDDSIINKDINKKFTELYEECFFKTLFEKIPDSYKTMLVQQYRCHEHIMHVFNHFYRGELKLGWPGQNNKKQHNVRLFSNGRNIIEPDKHIYFIDCKGNETHETDSTSMYNTNEARVVAEMIKKLNNYFKDNPTHEKLSIGVICTYGDQARRIKEVLRSEKVRTDAFKTDVEKMIVSTVDDFQGDERDIIILSTVRNPENPAKSNPGFILAYQRINVALSRARRMLIVVGNRNYLESKGVIDLPDVHGRIGMDQRGFRVYEEILSTIERYGKVIDDNDVDLFLVSSLSCSLNMGVNGIGVTNIIVNVLIFGATLFLLAKNEVNVFNKEKMDFKWAKEFAKVGGISGVESFVRNLAYMVMIARMVNVVNEQGTYWVANSFIWGWLLLPVTQLGELIKQETSTNKDAVKNNSLGYFAITGIAIAVWCIFIPLYKPFMQYVLNYSDVEKLFELVMVLFGFYVLYAIQNVFDAIFYGLGKTHYMLFESIVTNTIYYGIAFILYVTGVWEPTLIGIALLFGIGNAFDTIVSLGAYWFLLKKNKINILNIEDNLFK